MLIGKNKYDLEIVSMEQGHEGKGLKKYSFENDLDTVGVFENEPFMIKFKNNTYKKVQVKISIDGTDILSGEQATTKIDDGSKSWVVGGYDTLELKAWPEGNNGGAEFIFGQTKNSVAANTHGDLSSKGIIAVAVFEERYDPQPFLWNTKNEQSYGYKHNYSLIGSSSDVRIGSSSDFSASTKCNTKSRSFKRCRKAAPAVGAGDYVEQKIGTAAGLVEPGFETALQLKYSWWSELRGKIRKYAKEQEVQYLGFPGDKPNIDLSNVPRMTKQAEPTPRKKVIRKKRFKRTKPEQTYPEYSRFV